MTRSPEDARETEHPERRQRVSSRRRFGLLDALLCTTGAAIFLAVVGEVIGPDLPWLSLLVAGGYAIFVGVAFCGLVRFIGRFWPGSPPISPGHWLLLAIAALGSLDMLLHLSAPEFFASRWLVIRGLTCWILLLPTLSRWCPQPWKIFFFFLVLLYQVPVVSTLLRLWGVVGADLLQVLLQAGVWTEAVIVPAVLLGLVIYDWRRKQWYDWLHWAGLLLWMLMVLMLWLD